MTLPERLKVDKPLARHFDADKLGVIVFGPGRGEAIVVIFPDATIGVVDGCREPTNPLGDPVRDFIQDWHRNHPEIRNQIRFIALTHPHDDHYGGLARLIDEYGDRVNEIWSTLPSGGHYANAYIKCMEMMAQTDAPTPLSGLVRMHEALKKHAARVQILQRGRHDVMMLKMRIDGRRVRVRCVAPCHGDILLVQADLMKTLHEASRMKTRSRPLGDPNLTSAALVVSWGYARVLLGGDLLVQSGQYRGWEAARPSLEEPVQVVKVAHHASAEAQDWMLWQRMKPALAIVTPFKHAARDWPPRPAELERLSAQSCVALTTPPAWQSQAPDIDISRNGAHRIQPKPQGVPHREDAVGVCLDAQGRITKIVLAGRADFYLPGGQRGEVAH